MAEDVLVVTGPTATGKTAVAVAVAERLGGEIVSMDSRQLYRGMDIGTAKPPPEERRSVPHHGFDLIHPGQRFNAGRFAAFALHTIAAIRQRGAVPILAGGTGFFLRALTHPLFGEPPLEEGRKEALKGLLARMPLPELVRWAGRLDPVARVRPSDRQRLARVVEVALLSGRPLSWWHRHADPREPAIDPLIFVLDLPRDELVRRIDRRVDAMAAAGLVAEVKGLLDAGWNADDPGFNTTGYIELVPYLRGECTLEEALDRVRIATRRYARRQQTWFRRQLPPGAVRHDAARPVDELASTIAEAWREREG
jgi:tRNA dimethylallyltransferase